MGTSLSWGMSRLFQYRHPQLQSMLKLCNLKITRFSSRTWKNIVISLLNFVSIIPTLCRLTRYKLDITITEGYNAPAHLQTISEAVQKKSCSILSRVMTFVNELILLPFNSLYLTFAKDVMTDQIVHFSNS